MNKQKNEGLINFLTSILKKNESSTVRPTETSILAASISILAVELKKIAESVDYLVKAVANQNNAIDSQNSAILEIYTVQEFMLKKMKSEIESEQKIPDINKSKREKPN